MRDAIRDDLDRPELCYLHEREVDGRRIQLRFALVEGRLVCIGLEIGPPLVVNDRNARVFAIADDAELDPLRSTEIRLPLRELIDEALERAVALGENLVHMSPEFEERWKPYTAAAKKGRKKLGRPALYGDDHYKQVGTIYEETLRSGRRDPLQAIMRELKIEKTAAASKVREARRRGFLTMEYFKEER